jgi:hypothetical protein
MTKPAKVLWELAKKIEPTSFNAGMAYIRKDIEYLNNHYGRGLPLMLPGQLQLMLPSLKPKVIKEVTRAFVELFKGFVEETQVQLRKDEKYASMKIQQYRQGVSDAHMNRLIAALRGDNGEG